MDTRNIHTTLSLSTFSTNKSKTTYIHVEIEPNYRCVEKIRVGVNPFSTRIAFVRTLYSDTIQKSVHDDPFGTNQRRIFIHAPTHTHTLYSMFELITNITTQENFNYSGTQPKCA